MTQRRQRVRGESRRSEILDAALRVFLRGGYRGATIDLVVSEANASKATIYSYFGGKEGLFTAIVEERTEQVIADLFPPDVGDVELPVAVARLARNLLTAALAPDALDIYRLVLSEGIHFPKVARTFYQLGPDRVTACLAQIFVDWRVRGMITTDDPERAAHQFLLLTLGDLHLRAVAGIRPANLNAVIEANVHDAVEFFRNQIGLKVSGSKPMGCGVTGKETPGNSVLSS